METNTQQADIICIYCTAPLYMVPDREGHVDGYVDEEGRERCPDSGWHRPVLTVEAIA